MPNLILFNKPFGVLCQFKTVANKTNLSNYIKTPKFYPAGRLDQDSEGLLLLTDNGKLQARITEPRVKLPKTYWVQVEGDITVNALKQLTAGVELKDGLTRPGKVNLLTHAPLPSRIPPIRARKNIPTSWIALTITEGKNRQVRRMTAAVGFPTLRLYRYRIGPWTIDDIEVGQHKMMQVNLPTNR